MGISKRYKRKITYDSKIFFWWVAPEFDGLGNMLSVNIASEDKKFLIKHFAVLENPQNGYIKVIGEYFPGMNSKNSNAIMISCPDFSSSFVDRAVTPKTVKDILEWCFVTNVK